MIGPVYLFTAALYRVKFIFYYISYDGVRALKFKIISETIIY